MTNFVAVLPSIHREWTERCVLSASPEILNRTIVVDNEQDNIGVAASWNQGVRRMYDSAADWLIIISAAMRFGAPGGEDFLAALDANAGALAVEAGHGIGWHLIAIARSTFDAVGTFDENYFPAYMEEVDWGRRVHCWLDATPPWWPKVSVDVAIAGFSHGIELGGVRVDNDALDSYYRRKWHGTRGHERTCRPFGDQDLSYWPVPRR